MHAGRSGTGTRYAPEAFCFCSSVAWLALRWRSKEALEAFRFFWAVSSCARALSRAPTASSRAAVSCAAAACAVSSCACSCCALRYGEEVAGAGAGAAVVCDVPGLPKVGQALWSKDLWQTIANRVRRCGRQSSLEITAACICRSNLPAWLEGHIPALGIRAPAQCSAQRLAFSLQVPPARAAELLLTHSGAFVSFCKIAKTAIPRCALVRTHPPTHKHSRPRNSKRQPYPGVLLCKHNLPPTATPCRETAEGAAQTTTQAYTDTHAVLALHKLMLEHK